LVFGILARHAVNASCNEAAKWAARRRGSVTWEGLGISPLAQACLDKALGFAVGFWRVGFGSDVFEVDLGKRCGTRRLCNTIRCRSSPGNRDAEALVVGEGGFQEGCGALFPLVRHDLRESNVRGMVNADVKEFPADAAAVALAGATAGDTMADPVEAAEFFDIELDISPGPLRS